MKHLRSANAYYSSAMDLEKPACLPSKGQPFIFAARRKSELEFCQNKAHHATSSIAIEENKFQRPLFSTKLKRAKYRCWKARAHLSLLKSCGLASVLRSQAVPTLARLGMRPGGSSACQQNAARHKKRRTALKSADDKVIS